MKATRHAVQEHQRLEKLRRYEQEAYEQGYRWIAGIDEVGRGPIAGPVVAAAVVLPPDFHVEGINDSKLLSAGKRAELSLIIRRQALDWSVAIISPRRIDQINILQATREAMRRAVEELAEVPDLLLIDAIQIPDLNLRQYPLIKGDTLSVSIACASIIAKVERDQMMKNYDDIYSGYGFAQHKGYCTRLHQTALQRLGPCPIHRQSFEPVRTGQDQNLYQPQLFD